MKSFLTALCTLLLCSLSHAASKYTGNYYATSSDNNPLRSGPKLVAGVNITVHDDGSLTGRGAYSDLAPITISGKVTDAGQLFLEQIGDAHKTTYTAQFEPDGRGFTLALPNGFSVAGVKIPPDFPEAGVYHVTTDAGQEAIFFLRRDHSVYGIVFNASGDFFAVEGHATTIGFSATSADGASFDGQVDGTHISGGYDPVAIEPLSLPFSGAKY